MGKESIPAEFIQELPKTDLHVHLDGSLRLGTLIGLANDYDVEHLATTESGLAELMFKDSYDSLADYLRGFAYTAAVMQRETALDRVAYELARDNQDEGVRYLEVHFAPQLHTHAHMSILTVLKAVDRGLARARDEFDRRKDVRDGHTPPFQYGIICSALRMFRPGFSEYYATLMRAHSHSPAKEVYALASLELVRAAISARDDHGLPVVGFDLAGEEAGYPAGDHAAAFRLAHRNFLKKTVHAGEDYGPESIFQAITDLYADRIGHGTYLLDPTAIRDPSIQDKEAYVRSLDRYIADRRITLEVCLSSNRQTNPELRAGGTHPLSKLREQRLSTTICTDNRLVSRTTVTRELEKAVREHDLDRNALKSVIVYGFKRSFYPDSYLDKRQYVRQIIDHYESIERKYFGEAGGQAGGEAALGA